MESRKTTGKGIDHEQSKGESRELTKEQQTGKKPYGRYANILTDSGFKAVFGDERNKDVLRDFLNEILPGGRKIRTMEYSTTEIPGMAIANKGIRIDLRCKGEDGAEFIIEMQRYGQDNFFKRCVSYASRVYDSHLVRLTVEEREGLDRRSIEELEYDLRPVFFIGLMAVDFPHADMEKWRDRYISEYTFREKSTGEVVCETIFLTFVELNRFGKRIEECEGIVDKWCFALKHIGDLADRPEELQQEVFRRFFEASEIARFDRDKRLKYEEEIMTELDYYSIINTAARKALRQGREEGEAKGREEGKAEGFAKGEAKAKLELAKAMKSEGLSEEMICRLTGLSEEQIAEFSPDNAE